MAATPFCQSNIREVNAFSPGGVIVKVTKSKTKFDSKNVMAFLITVLKTFYPSLDSDFRKRLRLERRDIKTLNVAKIGPEWHVKKR
jgi:hypothetical protein